MWHSLGIPGERNSQGRGVSYCATCDGPLPTNRSVVVVGGGDCGHSGSVVSPTHFASKVIVIHRRDRLRAAGLLQKRAFNEPKIEFAWDSVPQEITGNEFVTDENQKRESRRRFAKSR